MKTHIYRAFLIMSFVIISLDHTNNCFGQSSFSNNVDSEKKGSKFAGGTLNLQFGTTTLLDVSPHFGTYLTNQLSLAGGVTFAYYKDGSYHPAIEQMMYGGRVFARYDLFSALFLHAEIESLNIETYNSFSSNHFTPQREWLFAPLAGIGYRQMFSELSGMYIMALWNFNESLDYPYMSPIFRIGLEFGY